MVDEKPDVEGAIIEGEQPKEAPEDAAKAAAQAQKEGEAATDLEGLETDSAGDKEEKSEGREKAEFMAQQVRDQVTILRETFEDGSEKYAKGPMQQSDLKKRVLKVHDEFSGYTSSMRPLTEGMSNSDVDLVKKELKVLYKQLKGLGENPY
ncbi:MAG: hypothetical protein HQ530_02830 [Parcubacteria group bacterium]|nr:hypothetical protein [Parcubacteria group bacterium]